MAWLISKSLMNSLCSQEQAAESSADACSDGKQYVPLKSTPIVQAYLCSDKTTAFSRLSRYGMTLEHLAEIRGEELLTLFQAGFPAKTLAQQEEAQESTANAADSGEKWQGSLAKYDRDSRSWKTRQGSFLEGLDVFSGTWPKWGIMRNGELSELAHWAHHTHGKGCGLWPTPRASDYKGATSPDAMSKVASRGFYPNLPEAVAASVPNGGALNPEWDEWLMGWLIGWTELKPLEMAKFRQWLDSHGKY